MESVDATVEKLMFLACRKVRAVDEAEVELINAVVEEVLYTAPQDRDYRGFYSDLVKKMECDIYG